MAAAQQLGPCDGLASLRATIRRRLQRRAQLAKRPVQRTHLVAGIDATALTEDWSPIADSLHWSDYLPSVNSFAISHQVSGYPLPQLAPQVSASGTCSVNLLNGTGGGTLTGTLSAPLSSRLRTRGEIAIGSEGDNRRLAWGLTASVHPQLNLDLLLGARLWGGSLLPSYQVSATSVITPNVMVNGTVFSQGVAFSLGVRLGGVPKNQRDHREHSRNADEQANEGSPNDGHPGGGTILRTSIVYNWMRMGGQWSGEGRLTMPLDTHRRRLHLRLSPTEPVQMVLGVASPHWSMSLELGAPFGVGLRFGIPIGGTVKAKEYNPTEDKGDEYEDERETRDGDEDEYEDEDQDDDEDIEEGYEDDPNLGRRVRLSLPIYISRELSTQSLLLAIAVPSLLGTLFENFIMGPWRRTAQRRAWAEWRAQQKYRLAVRQEEAAKVCALMEVFYPRRVEGERERNGLIITKALYRADPLDAETDDEGGYVKQDFGSAPTPTPTPAPVFALPSTGPPSSLDVRIPLQMAVVDSQLQIPGNVRKADLLGFYDVAPGLRKTLLVEYTFRGHPHRVLVGNEEALLAPLHRHRLA